MDHTDYSYKTPLDSSEQLLLDHPITDFLRDASKWAAVVSIIGFIILAVILIVGLFIIFNPNPIMNGFEGILLPEFVGIIYLLFVLVGFFPLYYLAKF